MIEPYLNRLGLPREKPSLDYLFELHRAHVTRITYTNLQIMRGSPAAIAPEVSVAEVIAGRNGYCFHLNGAFAWLLRALGFEVTMHRGFVRNHGQTQAASLNHLVLIVHSPDAQASDGMWFVDGGLGDGPYEPLPLSPGTYRQGPFQYSLSASPVLAGWRFDHDPAGSFALLDFESAAAAIDDFAQAHQYLSTSPESSFRRFLVAQVREPTRVRTVRGCTLLTVDGNGKREEIFDDPARWRDTLMELGLPGEDLPAMWAMERERHETWLATK